MTRTHLIGGTDAADLLGIGFTSPTTLYLRLRGEIPDDFEGNEATAAGKLFEDRVAVDLIREKHGLLLERPSEITLALPDEPRIGVSLDFDVVNEVGKPAAEIKLTGSRRMWGELEKVPPSVGAQAQFQMAVARASGKRIIPVVHVLAMFVPGFITEDFPVEEDREVGSALLESARAMLRSVDDGTPPDPRDAEDARKLFFGRMGETYLCSDSEAELLGQLRQAKAAKKEATDQEKALLDELLPLFGNATEIVHHKTGELLATWRPSKYFDTETFAAVHPDLFEEYRKDVIDVTRLRKDRPSLHREFSVLLGTAGTSNRPFLLTKER